MNIESLLISGGLFSQYFGVNSNLAIMINSILGGYSIQYFLKSFDGILVLNPIIYLFSKLKNIFMNLLGLTFYTISISKEEKIVYNKFQDYILKKYYHFLNKSTLSSKDNINLTFSLDKSKFSSNLYDEFEGKEDLYNTIRNFNRFVFKRFK